MFYVLADKPAAKIPLILLGVLDVQYDGIECVTHTLHDSESIADVIRRQLRKYAWGKKIPGTHLLL